MIAQVGMRGESPVPFQAQDTKILHRNDQQAPVRKPAKARGLAIQPGDDLRGTVRRNPQNMMRIQIRYPPMAIAPACAFKKMPAFKQSFHQHSPHHPC